MKATLRISALALSIAMLTALPANAATIKLGGNGPLVNTGGSTTDPTATIGTGGTGETTPTGAATSNALNAGNDPTTGNVRLGNTPGGSTNGNVLLDLFGNGGGNDADVALGNGGGTAGNVGLDLFGNGGGAGTGGVGAGGAGANGGNVPNGAAQDLFGNGGGSGGGAGLPGVGNGRRVASTTGSACFSPNVEQTAKLVSRHQYDAGVAAKWNGISDIKIIDVGLCNGADAAIASEPNIARLQEIVSKSPAIKASLAQQGHEPGDVIAIDRSGSTLMVYVS